MPGEGALRFAEIDMVILRQESGMSATGVTALDHTIQETNVWLKAIDEQLHFASRQDAYNALRAVLHALRERLPAPVAAHLGAQLPILIRGIYYEGWHLGEKPTTERKVEEFTDHVRQQLPARLSTDPLAVTRGVFEILWERIDPDEFAKVMEHLPVAVRNLRP